MTVVRAIASPVKSADRGVGPVSGRHVRLVSVQCTEPGCRAGPGRCNSYFLVARAIYLMFVYQHFC